MDVWRITVAALRRWYVLIPLLALSALAAYVAGQGVQPEYEVAGSAMVVPGPTEPTIPNPYGNVEDANTVLGIVLNSPETHAQIAAQGLSPNFEVTALDRSTIWNFNVRADTPEVAIATGQAILDAAATELQNRQEGAGVQPESRYSLETLQQPAVLAVVNDGQLRNMAIIGVLGAAASLVVAVLFDDIVGLIRRRRRRKRVLSDDGAASPSDDAADSGMESNDPDNAPNDTSTEAKEPPERGRRTWRSRRRADADPDAAASERALAATESR